MKNLLVVLGCFILTGCVSNSVFSDDEKLKVAVTVGMLGDMVEAVGGDNVEVKALMGPGVDPHLYQPSAGDFKILEEADLIFYVGLHLEGKMQETFESVGERKPVIAITEGFDRNKLLEVSENVYDPHIWFDVDLWEDGVDSVEKSLIEFDFVNEESYSFNADKYKNELLDLDKWVKARVAELPTERRVLVTAHDAFGYFGAAYGFEVEAVQGVSTATDYGLEDLNNLMEIIIEKKVPAIFLESSVSPRSINALIEGVKAEGFDVKIGGKLYSDAMGEKGTLEGSYTGMVKYNVETIVNSLK